MNFIDIFLKALIVTHLFVIGINAAKTSNNDVKLLTPLKRRLQPGNRITIKGALENQDSRAQINLQFGDCMHYNFECDIPLHLEIRLFDNSIHRVASRASEKTLKEYEEDGGFPVGLAPYTNYTIELIIQKDFYEININGYYFCSYDHRISTNRINHIRIADETIVHSVNIEYGQNFNNNDQY